MKFLVTMVILDSVDIVSQKIYLSPLHITDKFGTTNNVLKLKLQMMKSERIVIGKHEGSM